MKKGDVIAAAAQPIARGVDWLFGTDWQNCGGCHQMQTNLNAGMGLADAVIARFWSNKQQPTEETNMGQPYVINEQIVIEDAESPKDAIAKYVAGEGQSISINAQVRMQPQQQMRTMGPPVIPPKPTPK